MQLQNTEERMKMSIYDLNAYEVIREEDLSDLKSKGILLKHKKSQAKILLFANDDENKVFTIGFRTPAPDSTGVPHIMEHSVLCGSKNFPVKDPFVELVKGSLNTFLNAMTYPDKTLYPVASCNSKDFQNLMHFIRTSMSMMKSSVRKGGATNWIRQMESWSTMAWYTMR